MLSRVLVSWGRPKTKRDLCQLVLTFFSGCALPCGFGHAASGGGRRFNLGWGIFEIASRGTGPWAAVLASIENSDLAVATICARTFQAFFTQKATQFLPYESTLAQAKLPARVICNLAQPLHHFRLDTLPSALENLLHVEQGLRRKRTNTKARAQTREMPLAAQCFLFGRPNLVLRTTHPLFSEECAPPTSQLRQQRDTTPQRCSCAAGRV